MLAAVTTATGGLRTWAHILHCAHVAQVRSQLLPIQPLQPRDQPQTCPPASTRCLSTTSGELAQRARDIGACPAGIPPVISFKEDVNTRKKAVTSSTEAAGVKLQISRYNPRLAKEQGKKAEAARSKLVKQEKRLKVTSGGPCTFRLQRRGRVEI